MIPLDTTAEAYQTQIRIYRRMGPEGRLRLGMSMCDEAREITREGIRARHPEYSETLVNWALFRLLLGEVLFRAAYPAHPVLSP